MTKKNRSPASQVRRYFLMGLAWIGSLFLTSILVACNNAKSSDSNSNSNQGTRNNGADPKLQRSDQRSDQMRAAVRDVTQIRAEGSGDAMVAGFRAFRFQVSGVFQPALEGSVALNFSANSLGSDDTPDEIFGLTEDITIYGSNRSFSDTAIATKANDPGTYTFASLDGQCTSQGKDNIAGCEEPVALLTIIAMVATKTQDNKMVSKWTRQYFAVQGSLDDSKNRIVAFPGPVQTQEAQGTPATLQDAIRLLESTPNQRRTNNQENRERAGQSNGERQNPAPRDGR